MSLTVPCAANVIFLSNRRRRNPDTVMISTVDGMSIRESDQWI
jgi:hypothetical protein